MLSNGRLLRQKMQSMKVFSTDSPIIGWSVLERGDIILVVVIGIAVVGDGAVFC
jgi:hypothetical protein